MPSAASGSSVTIVVEIDLELVERGADRIDQAEIGHGIEQQAADQEFEREIVNPLGTLVIGIARRIHPAVDDAVAHRKADRRQPVMRLGDDRILADRIGQLFEDFCGERPRVGGARGGFRGIVKRHVFSLLRMTHFDGIPIGRAC